MKDPLRLRWSAGRLVFTGLLVTAFAVSLATTLYAKDKKHEADPNDVTYRLFQLLDGTYGGKLTAFYCLGDVYQDPAKPGQEFQRVFKAEYDRNKTFGKLTIYVRSVGKMSASQLSAYSAQQIYDFGEIDLEKFVKTNTGQLGQVGDLFMRGGAESPLATQEITDDARTEYQTFVGQYLIPALQKK